MMGYHKLRREKRIRQIAREETIHLVLALQNQGGNKMGPVEHIFESFKVLGIVMVVAIILSLFAPSCVNSILGNRAYNRELTILQAEIDANESQAEANRAAADMERASGQRSFLESQGHAIEAPAQAAARAVDVNSQIVLAMGRTNTLYDRLLVIGAPVFGIILVMLGCGAGMVAYIGVVWFIKWNESKIKEREASTDKVRRCIYGNVDSAKT